MSFDLNERCEFPFDSAPGFTLIGISFDTITRFNFLPIIGLLNAFPLELDILDRWTSYVIKNKHWGCSISLTKVSSTGGDCRSGEMAAVDFDMLKEKRF
jgi:hypothetical protein